MEKHFARLGVSANWHACHPDSKHAVNGHSYFPVVRARFAVRSTVAGGGKVYGTTQHHGLWHDEGEARAFAWQLGDVIGCYDVPSPFGNNAKVIAEEYWYAPGYGRVPDEWVVAEADKAA